ncbi:tRNA-modifying protein YgfZ [Vibrio nigripulchritudo]|uniref:tRNA-modifying protein YgfZ n=1 Tax=Vibrio nigripulchritudo TaxID=28173 RepID=UPI0003B23158|nr:tRNA-modifying protein YgfZ [Vibrio nigripulchritudo]CCN72404.1 putative tRNA-modifying protein ygfZ 1 [Vibrio nigripulchritudo SFn118]
MDWLETLTPFSLSSQSELPELAICPLSSWGTITMVGDDKKSYLQGQVTCDVVSLEANESTFGAHCDAKGKMWSIFRIFHHNGGYALIHRKSALKTELHEIKKYAVFSKVTIEESDEWLVGVTGINAQSWIDARTESRDDVRIIEGGTAVKVSDVRWVLLLNQDAAKAVFDAEKAHCVSDTIWDKYDISEAHPRVDEEEQSQHIPQAMNLQALGGISFTKGCYTGQEMVARAKYRGTNKRALYKVSGNTKEALPKHAELERAVGENWRGAGKLIVQFEYEDNTAEGLLILPNNLEADTVLRVKGQENSKWTISALPYSLDDE